VTKEENKQYQAEYRAKHREENRLYQIAYRKNNPEKIKAGEEKRKEAKEAYQKEYHSRPEVKEHYKILKQEYRADPDVKKHEQEYQKEYNKRPEVIERKREYEQNRDRTEYRNRPEVKENTKINSKKHYDKQKQLSILKYTPEDLKYSINDDSTFLYIVEHTELPIIKIGISKNIDNRLKNVKNSFGEINPIIIRPFDNCRHIETSLHYQFEDYKYNGFKAGDGDGYTEWFYKDCLPEILEIFNNTKSNNCNTINLLQTLEQPIVKEN
jgi:hypothetical protein